MTCLSFRASSRGISTHVARVGCSGSPASPQLERERLATAVEHFGAPHRPAPPLGMTDGPRDPSVMLSGGRCGRSRNISRGAAPRDGLMTGTKSQHRAQRAALRVTDGKRQFKVGRGRQVKITWPPAT